MVHKKTQLLILLLITIAGFLLRVVGLGNNPPSLNWDEVSHAYNAYSLLQTGRDQWGIAFPFPNFRAYGDYPTVLNLYLTVPVLAAFGPTDFAARFPHVLAGVLLIISAFVLVSRYLKSFNWGLFAAFIVCVSPWTFFPSRAIFQSNWSVLLLTLGLAAFYSRHKLMAVLLWGFSLLAYHNTRIFFPLVLPVIAFVDRKNLRLLFVYILLFVLSVGLLLSSDTRARSPWVGILDTGAVARIEELRNISALPPLVAKLIFNRPIYFITTVAQNYIGYFSPRFLFVSGGTQYQFSLPGFGLFYSVWGITFYAGLLYLIFKRRDYLFIVLLLFSPAAAAITRDQFAVIRSTLMIPFVITIISLGARAVLGILPKHQKTPVAILVLLASLIWNYYPHYFALYPKNYSPDWQYGYRQAVEYTSTHANEYDRVIFTKRYGEPHEFVWWYSKTAPREVLGGSALTWDYHDSWYWVNSFSNYIFVNDWELRSYLGTMTKGGKTLVVASPDSTPDQGISLKTINFLNDEPAFIIKEI